MKLFIEETNDTWREKLISILNQSECNLLFAKKVYNTNLT